MDLSTHRIDERCTLMYAKILSDTLAVLTQYYLSLKLGNKWSLFIFLYLLLVSPGQFPFSSSEYHMLDCPALRSCLSTLLIWHICLQMLSMYSSSTPLFCIIFKSNLLVIRCYWNISVKSSYASPSRKKSLRITLQIRDRYSAFTARSVSREKRIECVCMCVLVMVILSSFPLSLSH